MFKHLSMSMTSISTDTSDEECKHIRSFLVIGLDNGHRELRFEQWEPPTEDQVVQINKEDDQIQSPYLWAKV